MELDLSNSILAGDPRMIDHIVGEVKSQGIFDKFRKECIADVDTKPAYQNLRTRVESSVNSFLNKQTWRTDLNKNQLRETLRKHIHDAPYLEVGVERIVDQVVNPKIYSVFMPQIEDVVYKFLGIERPRAQRNGACDLKDLLPKDLDPVSPESDRNSLKDISLESVDENVDEIENRNEQKLSGNKFDEKMQDLKCNSVKKEVINMENGPNSQVVNSSVKTILNSSFKLDETIKTEEEEEDSPVFEPIDIMNLNESNISNDSHLSGISELTSHRSQSPDFMTEFSHDNFDCSNQDSQLSKVSSNSRLSIVTDFGSSNHASTPLLESKDETKYVKENFRVVREFDTNKDNKFNFEVIKSKDNSKISNSSKENSRDTHEYKDIKIKEESKSKFSKDKYDSKNSRDKNHDSKRHHSKSDKYSRSKSKDKNESESQDSKENSHRYKENKVKEAEKKDEVKDLKDLYKEKIRELREKKELTEKEKLGKDSVKINKDSKDKKETSSSKEKDDYKKNYKSSSSSSRSSSYHKISRNAESKDSKDKNNSKRDDRRHSNGKSESKSSTKSKKDSKTDTKSESRSNHRSLKDKKRRDEKKSKSIDDHSSLRKNSNDRRSTDRDGSNGSSSKYSHKSSYSANNSIGKFGSSTNLTKDTNKDHHSSSEASDSVHDNLRIIFGSSEYVKSSSNCKSLDHPPKRLDPGSIELCLPLKKRPLHNDESLNENQLKKPKLESKKVSKRKIEKDIFRIDTDVTSVPDEERVQIIEIPDEEYEQPYPDKEPIFTLEETKKIILDAEPMHPVQSKLSEMEQSIRQSLSEMMSDHKLNETEDALISTKLISVMDSNTLLETLTDDSNNDADSLMSATPDATNDAVSKTENLNLKIIDERIELDIKESIKKLENNSEKENTKEKKIIQSKQILENKNKAKIEESIKEKGETEIKINEIIQVNVKMEETNFEEYEKISEFIDNKYKEKVDGGKTDKEKVKNVKFSNTEKTNMEISTHVAKAEKEIEEKMVKIDKDIEENVENTGKNIEESLQKTEKDIEKTDIEFSNKIQNNRYKIEKIETDNTASVDNAVVDQDEESIDNNIDEFNEHNKLIIDEKFIEKESDEDNQIQVKAKLSDDEKLLDCNKKDKANKGIIKSNESKIDERRKKFNKNEENCRRRIELKHSHKEEKLQDEVIVDNNSCRNLNVNDGNGKKPAAFLQERKQIKSPLIDELDNLKKDQVEDEIIKKDFETDAIIESLVKEKSSGKDEILVKSLQKNNKNPVKQVIGVAEKETIQNDKVDEKVSESNENNDDRVEGKTRKLYIICKEKDDETDQELTAIFNKESSDIDEINALRQLEKTKFNINITTSQDDDDDDEDDDDNDDDDDDDDNNDGDDDDDDDDDDDNEEVEVEKEEKENDNDLEQDELFTGSTTSKKSTNDVFEFSRINMLTSPFEEECHYLESDNQRYLIFKKYLEKLEADPSRSLEDMIESFGGVVIPAMPMAAPVLPFRPKKRKLSTSPLIDILITSSNNNNDGLRESTSEETSENSSNPTKKRKLGRIKKVSSTVTIAGNMQQEQQPQQPQHQQPQPQQIAIINGENFVMPLSPESDVSATSEKNPGNVLKDERSRHRSNQRYSSDDLYKPRPLFSSSSRRNRRFNQA